MTKYEVDEFEVMIESALDAGRAAARVYEDIDHALADWPLIDAFREGFFQEATASDVPQLKPRALRLAPRSLRRVG